MKKIILTSTALTALAGTAMAGGIERTTQSTAILFEEGRFVELSFGSVSPDVSGVGGGAAVTPVTPTPGQASGNMTESYVNLGFGYKADVNDRVSYALIYDQPYGANVDYPASTYFATGSTAEFNSNALTGILQYNLGEGTSVFGGLRAQTIQAEANVIPASLGYTVDSDTSFAVGYLVGAAYEKPEIALRVALTYLSAISHDVDIVENGVAASTIEVETPQALNLEFQTGVAEGTLVFGSVRWVEWSEFEIAPPGYVGTAGEPLVSYQDDRITYTLGVGRRLNENWSILGSLSYEETTGSSTGNLGPTDGFTAVGLGAVYRQDNMRVTGGIRYAELGDATTRLGGVAGAGEFSGNSAVGVGVRVGWSF